MRLTRCLMYFVNRRKIPGKITIGKHRVKQPISSHMKYIAAHDMIREQENVDILSKPYLSQEEDVIYQQLQQEKVEQQDMEEKQANLAARMPKHYTTLEALSHLNIRRSWD